MFFSVCGVAQENSYKIKTVVIDAGHGGKDPGAVGSKAKEKDITLAIALKTGELIEKYLPNVKVIYTRSTDVFVELHKRADIANKNYADLFISIHVNANRNKSAYGADSWVMGLHKSQANLEVAKLENKVISIEDNYETRYEGMSAQNTDAIIIHTMMQSANLELSATLASFVQDQFRERVGRRDRGVRSAPFLVLWKTTMPSVLIETGFITNEVEQAFLMTELGQEYMASAVFRAFRDYKNMIERKTNFDVDTAFINQQEMIQNALVIDTTKQLFFSVQIASSKNKIETIPQNFKGLENVFILQENKVYKYLVHKETDYEKLKSELSRIQELYSSAYIVAVQNNKRIDLQKALKQTQ
ncbi:MAG: N-acetylmuramoyl-L-alanine amidase [Bacteroidales bacterium]|nr:N-acetylmuramoyl-L-alanine amidase [Bacteroidales bacterium]